MSTKMLIAATLLAGGFGFLGSAAAAEITVYKNASCGCCGKWIDHMRAAGFEVNARNVDDLAAVKQRYGVPANLGSCHTAVIGRYVIEGHVPAADVARLLEEAPAVTGIAIPGMPPGSPGMESPYRQAYQSMTFTRSGTTQVFARH